MNESTIKRRNLGTTGFEVSEIGFGAWAIGGGWGPQDNAESIRALHRALDLGVNFIDTAAGYGAGHSERIIGEVLKERGDDSILVATKTPPTAGAWPPSPYCRWEDRYPESYLRENVEERLRNLKTEAIDLLQLHTWTRAWNQDPQPFLILQQMKREGKIKAIGISTPEHDQNAVVDLVKAGLVDTVQLIYNIFEQEPAAELLPVAKAQGVGIIVRVAFDEGVLTGKYRADTQFPEGDFRRNYFAGDRLARAVTRVEAIRQDVADSGLSLPQIALKFSLQHEAVSCVIPGIRNVSQAEANTAVSSLPPLSDTMMNTLRKHRWNRAFWYHGK